MKQSQQPHHNNTASSNQPASITIGHYAMGKSLGKGTFGKVKLATHLLSGEKVAVKILEKDKIKDKKDVERITREIKILKKVRHPHVIQLYEIIETEQELYLIMEFCQHGELFDYIVSHQRLHEKQACKYYQELISGIEYIHQSGICHRDLKPENLLLDFDKTLKIVDFGLSNMYEGDETLKTACGSPCYAAPEMIAGKRYLGLRTDIWSSGVVLFAMVCGFLPFEDPKTSNLYKKILNADYQIPKFVSAECADFLSKILNTNPDERYSIDQIRAHPWYRQIRDKKVSGLYPTSEKMPVNDKMYQMILKEHKFEPDYAMKCIEANRHNSITATYHLLYKKALKTNMHISDTTATGSIDRNHGKVTRTQKQEIQDIQLSSRRGQSTNYRPTDLNQTLPAQFYPAALQSVNGGDETQNLNNEKNEITAQKKYKLQLQAEINKLKQKYQNIQKKGEEQVQIQLANIINSKGTITSKGESSPSPDQMGFVQNLQQQLSQVSKGTQGSNFSQVNSKFYTTGANFNNKLPSATTTESTVNTSSQNEYSKQQSMQSKQSMGSGQSNHQRYKTQLPTTSIDQARLKYSQQGNKPNISMISQSVNGQALKMSFKGVDLNSSINNGSKVGNTTGYVQRYHTDTQVTSNHSGKASISMSHNKNVMTIDDSLMVDTKKHHFNNTLQTIAQIVPDKYTSQQKRGKSSSIDQTGIEAKKTATQPLNMSAIISSKNQFGSQDYSYPISANSTALKNSQKNSIVPKINDLRLQTALEYQTLKAPHSQNNTAHSKNHQLNNTLDFPMRQATAIPAKQAQKISIRYSAVGHNRNQLGTSPVGSHHDRTDNTSASLNISELYKQYSKKQGGNLNNTVNLSYMKPGTKGHLRAISVLDASSFNTQPAQTSNFTNRHGSHSQNRKAIMELSGSQNVNIPTIVAAKNTLYNRN